MCQLALRAQQSERCGSISVSQLALGAQSATRRRASDRPEALAHRGPKARPPGRGGGGAAVRGEGRLEEVEKTCDNSCVVGVGGSLIASLVPRSQSARFGVWWFVAFSLMNSLHRLCLPVEKWPYGCSRCLIFGWSDLELSGFVVPVAHL